MPRTPAKKTRQTRASRAGGLRPAQIAAIIGGIVCLIGLVTFFTHSSGDFSGSASASTSAAVRTAPSPFDGITITGNAGYVLDLTTGKVLYQKNAQAALPLASITKLMSALVTLDHTGTAMSTDTEVTIDHDSLLQAGDGGDIGLLSGEKWNANDLLEYSLISSSNVGTAAISRGLFAGVDASTSEADFIQEMNAKAGQLGLSSMSFYNNNGLDINDSQSGAYGSAQDVAKLMADAITTQRTVIGTTAVKSMKFVSMSGIRHTAINTDEIIGELPGLIASKTGFTNLAGGNLVVAFDAGLNHPIVIAVLGSTEDGRFDDVLKLASTTMDYLSGEPAYYMTQYAAGATTTPHKK